MTMRREGLAPEMRLHPLDPVGRRTEPDATRRKPAGRAAARSFKTAVAVLR
jgi:hypothetical protein